MRITRAIGLVVGVALVLALGPALHAGAQTSAANPTVKVLTLDGAVDPFIANYLKNGIEAANRQGDAAVVIPSSRRSRTRTCPSCAGPGRPERGPRRPGPSS